MTTVTNRSSWKLLGLRLLLALGMVVVGFAGLEGLARLRLFIKYGRASSAQYKSAIDPVTGMRLPVPNQTIGATHINSFGFRGADFPHEKTPGTLRIAFLGASTTFCAEVNDDAAIWPEKVTSALRAANPGLRIESVNAGIPGIGVEESRIDFDARVKALAPDVVVICHATNDLSRDTRRLALERGVIDEAPDHPSFLAEHFVVADLLEKNLKIALRRRAVSSGRSLLDCDFDALALQFEKRLDALASDAKGAGALVVLVTFPTQLRADQSAQQKIAAAVTSTYYMPYFDPPRLLSGFAAYNAAIRRAAKQDDAVLVDVVDAIPGDDSHFFDSVHFTALGCERLARAVSDALVHEPRLARRIEALRASR